MRRNKIFVFISIVGLLGLTPLLLSPEYCGAKTQKNDSNNEKNHEKEVSQKNEVAPKPAKKDQESEKKPAVMETVPVYKPPMRGAPVGRIAGGTRGMHLENDFLLCVLTPDHTGLTSQSQPSLYYFLGKPSSHPVEITLIEDNEIHPLFEQRVVSPEAKGVHALHLRDYDFHLEKDKVYKWFVAIIPDPDSRSKDILSWGAVKMVDIPENLALEISDSESSMKPMIYAEAGLWYDAFAEISRLIEIQPAKKEFRRQRAALLDQVGLSDIGKFDFE